MGGALVPWLGSLALGIGHLEVEAGHREKTKKTEGRPCHGWHAWKKISPRERKNGENL